MSSTAASKRARRSTSWTFSAKAFLRSENGWPLDGARFLRFAVHALLALTLFATNHDPPQLCRSLITIRHVTHPTCTCSQLIDRRESQAELQSSFTHLGLLPVAVGATAPTHDAFRAFCLRAAVNWSSLGITGDKKVSITFSAPLRAKQMLRALRGGQNEQRVRRTPVQRLRAANWLLRSGGFGGRAHRRPCGKPAPGSIEGVIARFTLRELD